MALWARVGAPGWQEMTGGSGVMWENFKRLNSGSISGGGSGTGDDLSGACRCAPNPK